MSDFVRDMTPISRRASSEISSLRDGSFSVGDFKHTELVNLRSDSKGNTFLNQYVVIKDLGQGAFGKVRVRLPPPAHVRASVHENNQL